MRAIKLISDSWQRAGFYFLLSCALVGLFSCQNGDSSNETKQTRIEYDQNLVGAPIQAMIERELETIQTLEKDEDARPALAASWQKLGMIFQAYQLRNQAHEAYERTIQYSPENWEAHYLLGLVSLEIVAPEAAKAAFSKSLELNPDYALTHFHLGDLARNQGQLENAATFYRQAIEVDEQLAIAWIGLGEIQLERKETAAAFVSFTRATTLQPDVSRTHYLLAQAHRDLGDDVLASEALVKSEQTQKTIVYRDSLSDQVQAYAQLGRHWMGEGDKAMAAGRFGAALDAYQQAIAYSPRDFVAIAKFGNACLRNGDLEGALDAYGKASAINPGNPLLQFNIGSTFMEAGRFQEAVPFFEKALQLEPKLAEAKMRLADGQRLQGKWEPALAEYDEALTIEPNYASAKLGRTVCLLALNRRVEASQYLTAIWRESHENPVIGRVLSRVLVTSPESEARNGALALEILAVFEGRDPQSHLLETKAMALAETGAFDEALAVLTQAIATAQKRGDTPRVQRLQTQALAYRKNQPWHKPYPLNHALFRQSTY